MRTAWIVLVSVAVLVAGCAAGPTEEQSPAGVEDRTASPGQPGAESRRVAPVDVTGTNMMGVDPALKTGILAQRSIFYDLDQYEVPEKYRGLVDAHAKYLREHPKSKMLVQGNTDERGSREYNIGLGQRRSDGVKRMLLLLGAREDQVESVSLGEEKPRSEGQTEEAWAQNRRSDILYQGEY
ncbi:MAG: peptidoglycan-associated lipoprotein Pal [Burkholderiales bacterium]